MEIVCNDVKSLLALTVQKMEGRGIVNVLIAADYGAAFSGNFIGSLIELHETMARNGHKAYFVFPKNENTMSDSSWVRWIEREGGGVYLCEMKKGFDEQLQFLQKIINDHSIEILHIHFGLFHHSAVYDREKLPVKIVVHEHMEYPVGCKKANQTVKYMVRSAVYRIKRIAFISVNKQIHRAHPFCKRYFIPNSLSMRRNIKNKSLSREEMRRNLNVSGTEKLVLFLGWDYKLKGLDIAIKAVAESRNRGKNTVLGVIGLGSGSYVNEGAKRFVLDRTGISPDESWIRWLPGGEDMFAFHRAADVYLSASRSEAFSYGILESISQNTPVVVSDIKGTNWCQAYSKAFTYPVEDAIKCADAIDEALLIGSANSNFEEICYKYNIDSWCEKIMMVYKTL